MCNILNRHSLENKKVKNLGWLIRYQRHNQIISIDVITFGDNCQLNVTFDDVIFSCDFLSKHICWAFLNRPIFAGIEINWDADKYILDPSNKFNFLPDQNPYDRRFFIHKNSIHGSR